jgi:hypothetical protein
MNTIEQLQPNMEKEHNQEAPLENQAEGLSANQVQELYEARHRDLKTMKQWVGLKFYYRAAEKIKQEEESLKKLLRLESVKQGILAEYSFVLDSAYFEQKFLNS